MHDPRRCLREHVRDLLRVSTDATAHLDHLDLAMPNGFTHSVELDVHMPSPAARLVVAVVDRAFVVHMDRRRLADVDADGFQAALRLLSEDLPEEVLMMSCNR